MNKFKLRAIATTALVASFAVPGAVYAQMEDEIVVTATKREKTLQQTPVAVTVTSEDTIVKTQILDIFDLQSVATSLRVNSLQTSANTNFIIRGFGNGANNAGVEPSVGVFIDGVYRSRSAAQIGDLPKLNRIEVLRGPQSTLFGKNASAGVISIVTEKPSFERSGYVEAGTGNLNLALVKAYITGPISENAAASIGGSYNKRDGYTDSPSGKNVINERDRFNIRGQLLIQPNDNLDMRFIADYSEIDEICCTVTNFQNGPTAQIIQALGGQLADPANPFAFKAFNNKDPRNVVHDGGLSAHIDYDFPTFALSSITSYRNNKSSATYDADFSSADLLGDVSLRNDIDTFTQEVRLTSTGDNRVDWMIGGFYFNENVKVEDDLVTGTAFRSYADILAGGTGALALIEAANGFAPGSFYAPGTGLFDKFVQDDESISAYGTLDLHVSDRLTLTGGLNYTDDSKRVKGSALTTEPFSAIDLAGSGAFNALVLGSLLQNFPNIAAACGLGFLPFTQANVGAVVTTPSCPALGGIPGAVAFGGLQQSIAAGVGALDLSDPAQNPLLGLQALQFMPPFLGFPNAVENGKTNDNKLTWTARAAFDATDNINVYASAATGFKASSWNLSRDSRPFVNQEAAIRGAGLALTNQSFGTRFAGPEEATVFELGLKSRFERGAINIAVFDQTIKGFQSNTFLGTGFVLSNAGKQSTQGIEVDATYVPVDPLKLTFAMTLLDPKYDSFVNAPGPNGTIVDRSGQKPAGIASVSIATSATYTHNFDNGMTGFIRADYQYESGVQVVEILSPRRTVNLVNASAGLSWENGLDLRFWGRNIFNDKFFTSAFPGVVQAGTINAYPNQPRTYGVSLRKSF
ncbi:MAG: TonB-dependent receptor [Robiginitomaculum sp.]|nr:TonB-dependent receptor [Robiginitomaculum sp.]MDQ7078319.1 TonB-dependent receptor [Robiginitomaculum sp.]